MSVELQILPQCNLTEDIPEKNTAIIVAVQIHTLVPCLLCHDAKQLEIQSRMALIAARFLALSNSSPGSGLFNNVRNTVVDCTIAIPVLEIFNRKIEQGRVVCEYSEGHHRSHVAKLPISKEMSHVVF